MRVLTHHACWRTVLAWAAAAGLAGCSTGSGSEEELRTAEQPYGSYDLTASYAGDISALRGWQIEWKVPELLNATTAVAVIGQWYNNFESGIYYIGDRWFVYYYGDDNGLSPETPSECDNQWGSGGMCGGLFSQFVPGQAVGFKYEFCTPAHVPSVGGTQNCLYVDLKDGAGWRFLAEDGNVRPEGPEMYTHDIEHFRDDGDVMPQVSCTNPTKMVRQRVKNAQGTWRDLTGTTTWNFQSYSPYRYQNKNLTVTPANWESCSQITASLQLNSNWDTGYCAILTVANAGPSTVSDWDLVVDLHESTMTSSWSANFTPNGSRYSVTPLGWNSQIPSGSSWSVGFCANKTGTDYRPVVVSERGT